MCVVIHSNRVIILESVIVEIVESRKFQHFQVKDDILMKFLSIIKRMFLDILS